MLQAVADELVSFIRSQPLDANPIRNRHRPYGRLKCVESAIFALKKVYLRPPDMLIENHGDILVARKRLRREVSHQICEDRLETVLDVLVDCLGVDPVYGCPHDANVAAWHGSVEAHSVAIHLLQEVQTLPVEVLYPPMPESGGRRRLHFELRCAAPADKVQRNKVQVVLQLLERKREVVCLQPWVVSVEDGHDAVARCLLNERGSTLS